MEYDHINETDTVNEHKADEDDMRQWKIIVQENKLFDEYVCIHIN